MTACTYWKAIWEGWHTVERIVFDLVKGGLMQKNAEFEGVTISDFIRDAVLLIDVFSIAHRCSVYKWATLALLARRMHVWLRVTTIIGIKGSLVRIRFTG